MTDPVGGPMVAPAAAGGAGRRSVGRWLLWIGLGLVAAVVLAVGVGGPGAAAWAWRTQAGSGWVLARVPGLQVEGWQGSLGGGAFSARRLVLAVGANRLTIDGLDAQGVAWRWRPDARAWVGLSMARLQAERVTWQSGPSASPRQPASEPSELHSPVAVDVAALSAGTVQVDALPVLTGVQGQLHVGADGGRQHRVQDLRFDTDALGATVQARIDTDAPHALALQARLQSRNVVPDATGAPATSPVPAAPAASAAAAAPAATATSAAAAPAASAPPTSAPALPAWSADLDLQGPLAFPALKARLQGEPLPGRAPPALDLQAGLRPFETWPLGALRLTTRELDLSALAAGAPRTRLQGQVEVKAAGLKVPASAAIELANLDPGRWDQGQVPVRQFSASVAGQPDQHDRLTIQAFKLRLGSTTADGGQVQGRGQWQGTTARLALQLDQLRPGALDARAAPMTLSGPLQIDLADLPLPEALRGAGAAAAAAPPARPGAAPEPSAHVTAQLAGRLEGSDTPPASLKLDAKLAARRVEIVQALAQAGGAKATLQGLAERTDRAASAGAAAEPAWHWKAQAELADFDPLAWWPGAPGSAWRTGTHRLNARLDSAAAAPLAALTDPLQGWRRIAGQLHLVLGPSVLANVPLQGELSVDSTARAASSTASSPPSPAAAAPALRVQGSLHAAGNSLAFDGLADPGAAAQDRLHATVAAPALKALAPLFALADGLKDWAPQGGTVQAEVNASGRAAALRLQAKAQIEALGAGPLRLAQADLDAQAGGTLDSPLALALKLRGLQYQAGAPAGSTQGANAGTAQSAGADNLRIDQLSVDLSGSARAHKLDFSADSPLKPPLALEQWLAVSAGTGTHLQLKAQGAWQPAVASPSATAATPSKAASAAATSALPAPGRWQGSIVELLARARNDAAAKPWVLARDLRAAIEFGPDGPRAASAEPGRIEVASTELRWTQARWQAPAAAGALPQIDVEAHVQDFALAPLLARAQPDFGWRGDLLLGGDLKIHSAQRFEADAVFERRSGDLSVGDLTATGIREPLGLDSLRLALNAREGVWHITQTLSGRELGELAGAVTVRTAATQAWPGPQAPIEGALTMHVAQLGVWGTWVPPGWRLGGELNTTATVGGRFGAPEFTGRLTGHKLSLRNVLEGVQLSDGEVDVSLEGARAKVEKFEFKGGDGRLALTGGATLGDKPGAQLQLTADHFLALGRVDRRVVASGQASLVLTPDSLKVEGKIKVDEGLFDVSRSDAPTLADDVTVRVTPAAAAASAAAANEAAAAAPVGPPRANTVALQIDLGDALRVRGRGINALLRGELRLTTPANKLSLQGTVRAENGTYAAYGQNLDIERGQIIFTGPIEDPRLDILAVRPNLDVKVGVAVTGSALNPRIKLFSEPDMSDMDKLSWLVLGRASDGLGRADTALLQRAAIALLSGEGGGPTDGIMNTIGLTDFSLRQTTGENDVRETVVSLGKQLSRRWYVGYERSVTAATGTFQVVYRIAQRFTLRAQSGADNSLDLIWTWRWN